MSSDFSTNAGASILLVETEPISPYITKTSSRTTVFIDTPLLQNEKGNPPMLLPF